MPRISDALTIDCRLLNDSLTILGKVYFMNVRWTVSLVVCSALLFCGALPASATEPTFAQNQSAVQISAGFVQSSTLMGTTVLNRQSQKLGRIKDVLLDCQTGQATFVLLGAEIPASGRGTLVVPYQALRVSVNPADHRQSVVLDLRPDQLPDAPQIQNDKRAMLQNPQFLEQARNFYQGRTYTVARPIDNAGLPSLAKVPNMPARNPVPQPSENFADTRSGLPQGLVDFYNE